MLFRILLFSIKPQHESAIGIPSLLNLPPISSPAHPSRLIHGSKDEREFNLKLWCSCHHEGWLLTWSSRKFYKMCFGKDQACKHENGRVDPQALIFWASRGAMRASTSLASAVCRPQSPGDICLMPSDANSVMLTPVIFVRNWSWQNWGWTWAWAGLTAEYRNTRLWNWCF